MNKIVKFLRYSLGEKGKKRIIFRKVTVANSKGIFTNRS